MVDDHDAEQVAAALRLSIGLFLRRLRQAKAGDGDLTLPESAALSRLHREGPATTAALARAEQISPQSMGATLGALEERGLVERRPDPGDGRRVVISVSDEGVRVLKDRRSARTGQIARALAAEFTAEELAQLAAAAPLIERLAHRV
ncbi:MarR family winged helix-turn-helix transcriptional regulator [Pseudonocardia acaciae]|uniref:MarR family winged helix-turn-helix transcriptional regulator n=1 Tax=Pseudonocardia acaciae TaxID=551276 RepID=UPI00048FD8DE|nr:MarR family transcriptional regulator [Pseudonocardia acaciae]